MIVLFTGCSNTRPVLKTDSMVKIEDSILVHPELPSPILDYNMKWHVHVIGEKVYVALGYNDSIEFRKLLEDMKRYIVESNHLLCYYRKDLKEDICKNKP